MRKNWMIVSVLSAVVSGMPASAQTLESSLHQAAKALKCENGATRRGWLDPSFDRERINLNTTVKAFSIQRDYRNGDFLSEPSITLLVFGANSDDFEMTQSLLYADFYVPEQDGCTRSVPQKISVTAEGRVIASSYNGNRIELAHWTGSKLVWNTRYEVIFPLVEIFCKYENCMPDYSGGFHIGMRMRERITPATMP